MDSNIKNIACLGKAMCISNEQHLSNSTPQFMKTLSNTEAELKKKLVIQDLVY